MDVGTLINRGYRIDGMVNSESDVLGKLHKISLTENAKNLIEE